MDDLLFRFPSLSIAAFLFVVILVANESGYRVGRHRRVDSDEGVRSQTNAIQAAMLGLLALLLGFTFTMALQRYDGRSEAVIDEANAIGTALLRTQLLPEGVQEEARGLMADYLRLRLEAAEVDLTRSDLRRQAKAAAGRLQERLWSVALAATEADPRPVTTGLYIQSLNELIDAYGRRDAALKKHVPEVVLLLLFAVFIIAASVLGYSGGLDGTRPFVATWAMSLLIVLVIFIIVDLDRPRRGWIRVNQDSMMDLTDLAGAARTASASPVRTPH